MISCYEKQRRVPGIRSFKKLLPNSQTHQEFLNLGIFSSFQVSAVENRDATAHPLQNKEWQ